MSQDPALTPPPVLPARPEHIAATRGFQGIPDLDQLPWADRQLFEHRIYW